MKNFIKEENEFLSEAAIDYVPLGGIYRIVADDYSPLIPTEANFSLMLNFIIYLFNKYKNRFHITLGPGEQINKKFDEIIKCLENSYKKGKYRDVDFGIWFDLDESVIPKKCLPKPMEDGET